MSSVILSIHVRQVNARTIIVPDEYSTIQSAIDNAAGGDTIYIRNGVYNEQVWLNKPLSLVGENAENTVVYDYFTPLFGGNSGLTLTISIENMSFYNAEPNTAAVYLSYCQGLFKGNIVHGNNQFALHSPYAGTLFVQTQDDISMILENNTFVENEYGLLLYMYKGGNVTLRHNTFVRNMQSLFLMGLSETSCIFLDETNTIDGRSVYFFDRTNNTRFDETTCPSAGYLGIVRSHNVTIENLELEQDGLVLWDIAGFSVRNVTSRLAYYGIYCKKCVDGVLENCTLSDNVYGLSFIQGGNITAKENVFVNNQCPLSMSPNTDYTVYEIDPSNSIDGREFHRFMSMDNLVIDGTNSSDIGFLQIQNCTNVCLTGLNYQSLAIDLNSIGTASIMNTTAGMLMLRGVNSSLISKSRFVIPNENCELVGVTVMNGFNCTLIDNQIKRYFLGTMVYSITNVVLKDNMIDECLTAFYVNEYCQGKAFHNNFVGNCAYSMLGAGCSLSLDDGYPSGGNYWDSYNGTDLLKGPYQNETGSDAIGDMQFVGDPYIAPGNPLEMVDHYPLMGPWTMSGENVTVCHESGVRLTFENVTTNGITMVNETSSGPSPPSGFRLDLRFTPYYSIETTADYTGALRIGVPYDDSSLTLDREYNMRLLQWDDILQQWTDITTEVDVENNIVFGETTHFCIFAPVVSNARCDVTGPVTGIPDGTCNMRDIGYFCSRFGTTPENLSWDPRCDVTGATPDSPDGTVNMRDIGIACLNFGKHV